MKPTFALRLTLALVIGLALAGGASVAGAEVSQLRIDPVAPLGRTRTTFSVSGTQPSPCYDRAVIEELTGFGGDRITLWFTLDASGGTCPQVPTNFTIDFVFDQGFPAGTYAVQVGERTFLRGGGFTDRVLEFEVTVQPNTTSIERDAWGWGAIKALFAVSPDQD